MTLPPRKHIEAQDPTFPNLRRRSMNLIYIAGGLSFVSLILVQVFGLMFAIFAGVWVIVTVQLTIYQRTQLENFHHYRQTEALFSLYAMLGNIRQPLPPLRLWAISPDFAALITGTILREKPKTVVELGSGSSTLISAYSLEKIGRGKVISFEHQEDFAKASEMSLVQHELSDFATVIHAPIKEILIDEVAWDWYTPDAMTTIEQIDLLIVDGPPETISKKARYPAVPMLFDKLSDGATILVDDYLRRDEHEMVNDWLQEYDLEVVNTLANEKGVAILRKVTKQPRPEVTETED